MALVVVALSGLAAACGSGGDVPVNAGATQSASVAAPTVVVFLQYQAFEPSHVTIHVGQTVEWKFEQPGVPGNVSFTGFASPTLEGGTWSYRFTAPGTYPYQDSLRAEATGVVVVEP